MTLRALLVRWIGLTSVGIRRTFSRATQTSRQRVLFSVLGVAVAIMLLVVVTGIGIGLATGTTVYDDDIDYWISPETDGAQSPMLATDAPSFGSVHDGMNQIQETEGVDATTPILSEVLRMETEGDDEYVLVMGIVNNPEIDNVGGVSGDQLSTGDPYYRNGNYDGEWTGEVVLSAGTADLLNVSAGDSVTIAGNESFSVVETNADSSTAMGNVPTAVVQLSELQTLTGAASTDQADQFVVQTGSPGVQDDLEDIYPNSNVLSRGELTASATMGSDLPLALSATAFIVAISIGTLFVVTTTGLEIVADQRQLATMSALGISSRSQIQLVGVQTLATSVLGGIIGGIGGMAGIWIVNTIAVRTLTTEPVAFSHPVFVLYAVLVSLIIGMLSLPTLLFIARRITGGVPE